MNLGCAVEKVPVEFTQRVDAVQLERSGFLSIQPAADKLYNVGTKWFARPVHPGEFLCRYNEVRS